MTNLQDRRIDSGHASSAHCKPHYLWSIHIDPVTMKEAVARVAEWVDSGLRECHYVVTPNVDHVVQLYLHAKLRPIYNNASMILPDGWPLVTMSRFYGKRLPERVPGSDLLPAIFDDYQKKGKQIKVFLLGGKTGVPERASENMQRTWPVIQVVGTNSPPFGFEKDAAACAKIVHQVNQSNADLLVLGLGTPKQEFWLNQYSSQLNVPVALAIGATIDFIAGEQTRAPMWVRKLKMEWLQRLATNPRRLAKRYAVDAICFPYICLLELFKKQNEIEEKSVAFKHLQRNSMETSEH